MTTETLLLFVLAAGAAFWYWQKNKPNVTPALHKAEEPPAQSPIREPEEIDPFLQAITLEKERTDSAIKIARNQHVHELETRFADDVKLKERLSKFAREKKLDSSLSYLWKEIRYYPAWSSRDDFEKWNKLNLAGISGSKEGGDTEFVEFSHGNQRFKITEQRWYGREGERYSDLSLFEDSEEVFAIKCSIHDEYDVDAYSCHDISAFKKRGNWPQVILGYYAQIQMEIHKLTDGVKYFRADEIKSRFEE